MWALLMPGGAFSHLSRCCGRAQTWQQIELIFNILIGRKPHVGPISRDAGPHTRREWRFQGSHSNERDLRNEWRRTVAAGLSRLCLLCFEPSCGWSLSRRNEHCVYILQCELEVSHNSIPVSSLSLAIVVCHVMLNSDWGRKWKPQWTSRRKVLTVLV